MRYYVPTVTGTGRLGKKEKKNCNKMKWKWQRNTKTPNEFFLHRPSIQLSSGLFVSNKF